METLRQLLRDIDNRATPEQLNLLGRLWTKCPKIPAGWHPEWPDEPELKTDKVRQAIETVGESILKCLVSGRIPPIPLSGQWNETEILEREHYVAWVQKVVDIQRGRAEAWRKFWVIQQLKTIRTLLKQDDGNDN